MKVRGGGGGGSECMIMKEGRNVLFNDELLNTFSYGYMASDVW